MFQERKACLNEAAFIFCDCQLAKYSLYSRATPFLSWFIMELPLRRACYGNSVTHTLEPLRFDPEYEIYFRHPAFLDPHDILIIIPGLDHPDGGIHHQTALDACAVLANNRYDGWFTEDREGTVRVKIPLDGILQKKNYYFQVSDNYQGRNQISFFPYLS